MRLKKLKSVLLGIATAFLAVGCTILITMIFTKAYNAGVQSAVSEEKKAASSSAAPRQAVKASASSRSGSSAVSSALQEHDLVLVNPDNPMPSWYAPHLTKAFGVQMDSSVEEPYVQMRTEASSDGVSLWISSAYRSRDLQSELFEREVETYAKTSPTYSEAVSAAEKSVARPDCSEHATGLALDLNGVEDNFDQSAAFHWLDRHAQNYGFILRYPKDKQSITKIKYEPWHYRYVGVENAKAMKKSGQCLEEYLAQKTLLH